MERIVLGDGAWLELGRNFLGGHERVFDELVQTSDWRAESRVMYDRTVAVPRLYAILETPCRHPTLEEMRLALTARYGVDFDRVSLGYYRDGRDSVAWHGDYVARELDEAVVATVSVGSPRRFAIKPTSGGTSMSFLLGWGDLLVMGGTCQRTHRHAVPKVAEAGPRIAIMFRPTWTRTPVD